MRKNMEYIKNKVSIVTPTYNDKESISETLKSLVGQTYDSWEWIIVDDGSTDDTEAEVRKLVRQYDIAEKTIYIKQNNSDQLNAIIHGLDYVTGQYIFILHSDDLLPFDDFFGECVKQMSENPDIDGLFGDLILIDEKSNVVGTQKVKKYSQNETEIAKLLLWLGRNTYSDVAFHKTEVYCQAVKDNYLMWNIPLWIRIFEKGIDMLNYKSVDFPVLKYRVHQGNYINNELGKMNVINGELRTATELMEYYEIPQYRLQYFIFRFLNKVFPKVSYTVRYKKKETQNKFKIVSFIIGKRYPKGVGDNLFLDSVLSFYRNNSDRVLMLPKISGNIKIYYGKDVRFFNKALLSKTLDEFYINFMKEMKMGFSQIIVQDEIDKQKVEDILKFMCINHVTVEKKL